jgi:hypothetical protein
MGLMAAVLPKCFANAWLPTAIEAVVSAVFLMKSLLFIKNCDFVMF